MEISKLSKVIDKVKVLNKAALAKELGISQPLFAKKISSNAAYTHTFSDEEKNKLLKILVSIGKELCKLGEKQ